MLKFLYPLLLCLEATLAHLESSDEYDTGICGYMALQPFSADRNSVCLQFPAQASLVTEGSLARDGTYHCTDKSCDTSPGHNWTAISPCLGGSQSDEGICVFFDASFAEGRGISIITTARRANLIAMQRAFVDPESIKGVNQDLVRTRPAAYTAKEIPGKGIGLIARRTIKRGELVMANTPSLFTDYRSFEWLSRNERELLQAVGVEYLPPPHRKAVMKLSTHVDASNLSNVETVSKITKTNSFDIEPDVDDDVSDNSFFVLFPEISRMNHDCRPNADYHFSHAAMTQYVYAIRDIQPGEEITVSYIDPVMGLEERTERLHGWGFQCGCHACSREPAQSRASDDRIEQIESLLPHFRSYKPTSQASPAMAELLVSLYQQEQLWGFLHKAYIYAALEYNGAGEPWSAVKYAHLALEYGIPVVGESHSDMAQMKRLVQDPKEHWSWLLRVHKREQESEEQTI